MGSREEGGENEEEDDEEGDGTTRMIVKEGVDEDERKVQMRMRMITMRCELGTATTGNACGLGH
eukprot:2168179-Pyramimonas_sp.AAC.1